LSAFCTRASTNHDEPEPSVRRKSPPASGRAGAGLQSALGERAFGVALVLLAGRQLEAEVDPVEVEPLGLYAFAAPLAPAEHAQVARLGEIPAVLELRAHVIMDVRVIAIEERQRRRYAPGLVERVIDRRQPVAVDGPHLIVVLRYLAHADLAACGARLVLIDVLEAQVEARARLGPRPLHAPARIHHAECRAAGSRRLARQAAGERCDNKAFHALLLSTRERERSPPSRRTAVRQCDQEWRGGARGEATASEGRDSRGAAPGRLEGGQAGSARGLKLARPTAAFFAPLSHKPRLPQVHRCPGPGGHGGDHLLVTGRSGKKRAAVSAWAAPDRVDSCA
jgi:hypothetical protein